MTNNFIHVQVFMPRRDTYYMAKRFCTINNHIHMRAFLLNWCHNVVNTQLSMFYSIKSLYAVQSHTPFTATKKSKDVLAWQCPSA